MNNFGTKRSMKHRRIKLRNPLLHSFLLSKRLLEDGGEVATVNCVNVSESVCSVLIKIYIFYMITTT
jgi:hypothetical protein